MSASPASPTPARTAAQSEALSAALFKRLGDCPKHLCYFYDNEEQERENRYPPNTREPVFRSRYAFFDLPLGDSELDVYYEGRMKCSFDDAPTQTRSKRGTGPFRPVPLARGTRVEGKDSLVVSRTDLCEHLANILRSRLLPTKPLPFGPPFFNRRSRAFHFCHIGIAEHLVPLERVLIDLAHDCGISSHALLMGAVLVDTLACKPESLFENDLSTYSINCFVATCMFLAHKLIDEHARGARFNTGDCMMAVFGELCNPEQRAGLSPSFFAHQEWALLGFTDYHPLFDIRADYSRVFQVFLWQKGGTLPPLRDSLLRKEPSGSPPPVESVKAPKPQVRYWVEQIPPGMTAEQFLASQRGDARPPARVSVSVNVFSSASLASFASSSSSSLPPSSPFPEIAASDYAIPVAKAMSSASTSSASSASASSSSIQMRVAIDVSDAPPRRRRIHKKGQAPQRVEMSPPVPRPKPVVVTKRMKAAPVAAPAPPRVSCVIDLTLDDDSDSDSDVEFVMERKAPAKPHVVVTRAQKQANKRV